MYRQACQYLKHYIKFQICHGKTENMVAHTHTHIKRKLEKDTKIHIKNKCFKSTHYRQTLSDGNKHNYKPNGVPKNRIIENC